MRIVNHQIVLRLREEQDSSNVLEVSLVINQYYSLLRMLRSRSRQDFKSTKSQTQSKNDLVPENLRKLKSEGIY